MNVTIVDSIMGSGKTEWAIQYMIDNPEKRFIYITPFLDEIEKRIMPRLIKNNITCYTPEFSNTKTKRNDINYLIMDKCNIISTHALFTSLSLKEYELLKNKNYILILDEVVEVIRAEEIAKKDIEHLIKSEAISIDENTGIVSWLDKDYLNFGYIKNKFEYIKIHAENHNLIATKLPDKNTGEYKYAFFFWQFPACIFDTFDKTYILTYLFKYQVQKYYFDFYDVKYDFVSISKINDKFQLIPYVEKYDMDHIKSLITILDHKNLNKIGKSKAALSAKWFSKSNKHKLSNNLINLFTKIFRDESCFTMWTVFSEYEKIFTFGHAPKKNFLPCNARSTNNYSHKTQLAYCVNRFMNPILQRNYFEPMGLQINNEGYALSEMIQWIWRSAIRNSKKIDIYIPSRRMREIFISWLDGELF